MAYTCAYCKRDFSESNGLSAELYNSSCYGQFCSKQCQMAYIKKRDEMKAKDDAAWKAECDAMDARNKAWEKEHPELAAAMRQQAWREEHKLWNPNFFLHVLLFTVGWIIFSAILKSLGATKFHSGVANFFAILCAFGSIPISIVQNVIICKSGLDYDDYKTWYLPPIAIVVLTVLLSGAASKIGNGMQTANEKKAREGFAKIYNPEMDIVLGKELITYKMADDGTVNQKAEVLFGKDGLAFGKPFQFDLKRRIITVGKGKKAEFFRYCTNGIAVGQVITANTPMLTSLKPIYPVKDAHFSADTATEVIGKSFSGKWNDDEATIKFGKDGKASIAFGDGTSASGSYLASDDDNIVLYNHRDRGLWYVFSYSDKEDSVKMWFAGKVKPNAKVVKKNDEWKKK